MLTVPETTALPSTQIGALVMALTHLLGSPGRTLIVTTTLLLIFALFAGFLESEYNIPWALRWICYVSPFRLRQRNSVTSLVFFSNQFCSAARWAWQALVVNEVRPSSLFLAVADLPGVSNYPGGKFLQTFGVDPTALTTNIIVLVCE